MKSGEFRQPLLRQAFVLSALADSSPKVLNQTVHFVHQSEVTPALYPLEVSFIYLVLLWDIYAK